MQRPADVTEEMVARWEASRLEWALREPDAAAAFPHEAYYTGHYIAMKLRELGCTDEDLIERIVGGAGQRQANREDGDYWAVATWVVDEFKQGRYELSGEELAHKLFTERFGENPDPVAVMMAMAQHSPDKGAMFEKIMTMRFMMHYGPQDEAPLPEDTEFAQQS